MPDMIYAALSEKAYVPLKSAKMPKKKLSHAFLTHCKVKHVNLQQLDSDKLNQNIRILLLLFFYNHD